MIIYPLGYVRKIAKQRLQLKPEGGERARRAQLALSTHAELNG